MKITAEDRRMAERVFNRCFAIPKTDEDVFYEMCFCICAPQTTFKANIKVIEKLKRCDYYGFTTTCVSEDIPFLRKVLKPVRFYNNKAKWVAEAKQKFPGILKWVNPGIPIPDWSIREWLVKNVKGLGMKTASHFLRNLGATDLAIIDIHVLKFLGVSGKWKYLDLEEQFREKAKEERLTIAELDIVVWQKYSNTPWENYVR